MTFLPLFMTEKTISKHKLQDILGAYKIKGRLLRLVDNLMIVNSSQSSINQSNQSIDQINPLF